MITAYGGILNVIRQGEHLDYQSDKFVVYLVYFSSERVYNYLTNCWPGKL